MRGVSKMEIMVGYAVVKYWDRFSKIEGRKVFLNSLDADDYCKELREDESNKEITYQVKEITIFK